MSYIGDTRENMICQVIRNRHFVTWRKFLTALAIATEPWLLQWDLTVFITFLPSVDIKDRGSDLSDHQCSICLEKYPSLKFRNFWSNSNDWSVRLPCGHILGSRCIEKWLRKNKNCPLCRQHVFTFEDKTLLIGPGIIGQIPEVPLAAVILVLVVEVIDRSLSKLKDMIYGGIRVLRRIFA